MASGRFTGDEWVDCGCPVNLTFEAASRTLRPTGATDNADGTWENGESPSLESCRLLESLWNSKPEKPGIILFWRCGLHTCCPCLFVLNSFFFWGGGERDPGQAHQPEGEGPATLMSSLYQVSLHFAVGELEGRIGISMHRTPSGLHGLELSARLQSWFWLHGPLALRTPARRSFHKGTLKSRFLEEGYFQQAPGQLPKQLRRRQTPRASRWISHPG